MSRLKGKVAFVTGAGRGIGRAVALAYAKAGADLVLCSRTEKHVEETAAEAGKLGARVVAGRCDVGSAQEVRELVRGGVKVLGGIDILVNNAGVLGPRGAAVEVADAEWAEVLRVNLTGVFVVTRETLKASMLARRRGCVINVSSSQGRRAQAGWAPYAASKFGVEGLTQVWADECKDLGLRFYTLNPMATRTDMRAEAFPQEDPNTLKPPEAVAEAFLELAADDCIVPTGTAVNLDRATGRLLPA